MDINKYGFELPEPGVESAEYEEIPFDEGSEGIKKLWNRHVLGSMKLNTHERDELIKKLEEYSKQARTHVKNELTSILKEPDYKDVHVKYPTGKAANVKDFSYQSSDGQAAFRVGVIVEIDSDDAVATRKLNKVIAKLINNFIKLHKPPVSVSHELRIGRVHCIVPDRALLEHPMRFGKESEEDFNYNEFIAGTEGFIDTIKKLKDKVKEGFINFINNAQTLTAEDYEFIKRKGYKTAVKEIEKLYKDPKIKEVGVIFRKAKDTDFTGDFESLKSMTDESELLNKFNTDPEQRGYGYIFGILELSDSELALKSENQQFLSEVYKKGQEIARNACPNKWDLYLFPINDDDVAFLVISSPMYKNKNQVITPAGESYNLFEMSNMLSDYKLFNQNRYGFGLESNIIDYNHVKNDVIQMYESNESSGLIPIDMDFDLYAYYIGGTEGIGSSIGGFISRNWAKFRRMLHPIIKSDLKMSQEEFNQLKATFQTVIQKSIPGLEAKMKENVFLRFLMDNGGIIINKSVKDAFDTDSRLVSSILVTINSSKIKMDGDNYIIVNGKKKDIMDLRNDDRIFNGRNVEEIIYGAINDIISSINSTIYKEMKKEPSLNKLGISAALLNDGSYTTVKEKGRSSYYNYNSGDAVSKSDYEFSKKNTITEQMANKDLLIGLRSRPLVVTKTENVKEVASESEEFNPKNLQGGLEMKDFTSKVEDIESKVSQLKEMPIYNKGVESKEQNQQPTQTPTINNTTGDAKAILHKVLDEFGVDGLKKVLEK